MIRPLVLALSLTVALAHAAPRPPVFALRALGVLGGDVDTNVSCFLLGVDGEPATVMIDGGSVVPGVLRWLEDEHRLPATWSERVKSIRAVLAPVGDMLLTHAHLDHLAGFVLQSTLALTRAAEGHGPVTIHALPATIDAVRSHAIAPPLWADFTRIPSPTKPALATAPMAPGRAYPVGPFLVQAYPIAHPVPCAGFLITHRGEAYLHLGDTSSTRAVWTAARPYLHAGHLRAVAVEVSFPARQESLAHATGHLSPASLVPELARLAGLPPRSPTRRVARALSATPIVALHIKAALYDEVVAELHSLRREGLNIVIPEQGHLYRF